MTIDSNDSDNSVPFKASNEESMRLSEKNISEDVPEIAISNKNDKENKYAANNILNNQATFKNALCKRNEFFCLINGSNKVKVPNSTWSMCSNNDSSCLIFQQLFSICLSNKLEPPENHNKVNSNSIIQ